MLTRAAKMFGLLACVGMVLAGSVSAATAKTVKAPKRIALEVTVVEAGTKGASMDPKLKSLARELKRAFSKHTQFTWKQTLSTKLAKAKPTANRLKIGKTLVLTYLGVESKMLRVQLSFDGAQSVVKIRNGGLWFYARRLKGNKALILAIKARALR